MDTRHEVDQLVLELQKVKQEVSKEVCVRACVVCVRAKRAGWLGHPSNWIPVCVCVPSVCVCACRESRVAGMPQ